MSVPYIFANQSGSIPLSELDANFTTLDGGIATKVNTSDLSASTGSTLIGTTNGSTGSVPRTVASKLNDTVSVKDFGAVGDGVTDDTVAINNAGISGKTFSPAGIYLSTKANITALIGTFFGIGQIKTADGNKNAPYVAIASSAPSSLGNSGYIGTAFNGDISKCQFPVAQVVTGAATLGQPTTGYQYTYETTPYYTQLYNSSGWNQSTSGNVGRTAVTVNTAVITHIGQGDAMCYNGSVYVSGAKAGATSFLANPAGGLLAGEINAGANGIYCNPMEINCTDNGFDVAAIGLVNNFSRTNNTGALNTVWIGYRAQSNGTKPLDAFLSIAGTGGANNGLDLVNGVFGANQSAISLAAEQRIYFNNTSTPTGGSGINWCTNNYGGEYMAFNASREQTIVYGQNAPQLAIGRTASAVNVLAINGSATTNAPTISSQGSDTNIDILLIPKGSGGVSSTSTIRTAGYTVAALPTAGTAGRRAYVTNALAPVFGSSVAGGGSVVIPVFDNGTAWIVG